MHVRRLTDREEIAEFLGRDPMRNLYAIGDLDAPHWEFTRWWGAEGDGGLTAVVLLYTALRVDAVLALGDTDGLRTIAAGIGDELPRAYHLSVPPDPASAFGLAHELTPHGHHPRMALSDVQRARQIPAPAGARWLTPADAVAARRLYDRAFPDSWFEEPLLVTGRYAGVERGGELVACAGTHVWSPARRVAAIGNVATAPECRGGGLAQGLCAMVARRLVDDGCAVGLNVSETNSPARSAYRRVGFEDVCVFAEFVANRRPTETPG